jgi:hypothetical protein
MSKRTLLISIICLICVGQMVFASYDSLYISFESNEFYRSIDNQTKTIPDISQLHWALPPDVHIGSFEDYLKKHPYGPASFGEIQGDSLGLLSIESSFSILVHQDLYSQIIQEIEEYKIDIENQGYSVYIDTVRGGTPTEIKNWVIERYQSGSIGFLFIGDIPAAWAEVSDSQFPCDLFYMDLDGEWLDTDGDGIYETHTAGTGDMGPEVYIGRLYTSTLTYEDEISMIRSYLKKAHFYRNGELTMDWKALEYVDEDWYTMDIYLDAIYFDNVSRYDYGHKTTASDYLQKLSEGHHFVTVCAHSYPGGHHFGTRPTQAVSYSHIYVFSPTEREAKLLLGSDDGIKVWLNGENIITKDVYTSFLLDRYRVDVMLQEGWNSLLCKISQEGGNYQFSARFTDKDLQTFTDLNYQLSNPEFGLEEDPAFIRSWLVNGFHQDVPDNFWNYLSTEYLMEHEESIVPSEGDSMGGKIWTIVDSSGPYIDLDSYGSQSDFGVSYAFVNVLSSQEITCHLHLGYDDGCKVWLNGECVLEDNRYGGFQFDMREVPVTLKKGENTLLVKISEWMGSHGFSARFSTFDDQGIADLEYDPIAKPISYLSSWLIHGVYENPDATTRLSLDYLNGEAFVRPSEEDVINNISWVKGIGSGRPFDLGLFFDKGDWVYSQTIQEHDPPVLFYNLFACGPGRFTDEDYLAGSYIYHTSYGLISVASSKSGSMLNFKDFTRPLGEGKTIGESFMEWFDAQSPYVLWEKEWYYGMILQGDPLLTLFVDASSQPKINIIHPENGIYFNDSRICRFFSPLVFGPITLKAKVLNQGFGLRDVSFYIDGKLVHQTSEFPFNYTYEEKRFGRVVIESIMTDIKDQQAIDRLVIWKFF